MKSLLRNQLGARWRSGLVGAVLCVGIGFGILKMPMLGEWLEGLSYDLPFAIRGDVPVDGVRIVAMDDRSYEELSQTPGALWDRALHITLLQNALALGARAVVFDIWFEAPWEKDPRVDQRFAATIKAARAPVVLAGYFESTREGGTNAPALISEFPPPLSTLAEVAPWGVPGVDPAPFDLYVRRHYTNANLTPLPWKVAEVLHVAPADPLAPRWINYYGALERKSYHDVWSRTNLPVGFFSNQVVFVGAVPVLTSSGLSTRDLHRTPLSRWRSGGTPGVEILATQFLNLERRDWLNEVPFSLQALVYVGCGLLFGFGLVLMRPWIGCWVGVAGALAAAGVGCWLALEHRYWFPWLIVSAVQVPVAFGWSLIAHSRWLARENRDLEEKLATSLQAAAARPSGAGGTPNAALAIPDHTLLRCVGRGAYGEVWLARDLVGSFRAVKLIYRDRFPEQVPFEREFRGIQQFSPISRTHPGWVDILHIGSLEGESGFFYIMEAGDDEISGQQIDPERYVPRTLAGDIARRGKLPMNACLSISLALADALEHLHRHSLIHRDIKPANVIFLKGAPKFADIGLVTGVRVPGRDVSMLGTEGYIAPEGPGTASADVFSLGKLIYEISTGRDRRVFPELSTALVEGPSGTVEEELYRIVLKTCEAEPRFRYASAAQLHADLLRLQETLSRS